MNVVDNLVKLAVLVPCIVVVSWVATRLLGVRRSWSANLIAAVLGSFLAVFTAWLVAQRDVSSDGVFRNSLIFAFVFTMIVAVGVDLIARPGSLATGADAGLFTVPRPIRHVRQNLSDYRRTREILHIASKYGLAPSLGLRGRKVRAATARGPIESRLQHALEECGGMFVKLGQVASTRADLLPPNVIAVLSELQSHVAPEAAGDIREMLEEELGMPVGDVFSTFDWEPLAAASIGQVYTATLHDGTPVIVKVQRPRVAELVRRDTEVLLRLARLAEANTPIGRQYGVHDLAQAFAKSLAEELDFRLEATNATTIAANLPPDAQVHVPIVHDRWTTSKVLVQERFDGVSASDSSAIDALGADREVLADSLLHVMLNQILVDGFFHSDPHPGNVLVLRAGGLGLIDFGATGRLDPFMQASLRELLIAVALRDASMLRQTLGELTDIDVEVDPDVLERALARFMSVHIKPGTSIDATAIEELLKMLTTFGIRVPAALTVFSRALVILEGTLSTLCPGFRLSDKAQAVAGDFVQAGSDAEPGDVQDMVVRELVGQLPTLRQLPRRADRIGELLERGSLTTRVSLFSTEADVHFITRMVNRSVLAFVGAVLALVAALLLGTMQGPVLPDGTAVLHAVGYGVLACAGVLLMRVVAAIVRDGVS